MPQIRYLRLQFDIPLSMDEVRSFRAAIIELTGREEDMFHNHAGKEGYIFRYPLIQYKCMNRKAGMVCIEDGTDVIHHLFSKTSRKIRINESNFDLKVHKMYLNNYRVQCWNHLFQYRIRNWLALNTENYKAFQQTENDDARKELLARILKNNIITLAKGINWTIDTPLTIRVTKWKGPQIIPYKNIKLSAFDVYFELNVSLPEYIGLGKSASSGFGTVNRIKLT